jgi:membrane-bound ClpP family serine protease
MRRGWRLYGLRLFIRKGAGLLLAVVGIALIVETMPTYLWLGLMGIALVWWGWMLFGVDRRRWI